ncbi:kxDL motif-containing protein 1-like [Monodelphis domestica]|uniref:kxDL motif-containing protein 1-like n=1 Tax=Monodelphis domestica TaxID=13616 RepID=UPI0000F2DD93|nr:kxDL motif-containing protein 1-like [Monodelphis domestica]
MSGHRRPSDGKEDQFEKTNEMVLNFNKLSNIYMQHMSEHFTHQSKTMMEMRKDLDSIYFRLQTLKIKLSKEYQNAFNHIHESPIPEEEEDDDVYLTPASPATTIATSEQSKRSCDPSPDITSPVLSPFSEDLSQENLDSPDVNKESLTGAEDGGERA